MRCLVQRYEKVCGKTPQEGGAISEEGKANSVFVPLSYLSCQLPLSYLSCQLRQPSRVWALVYYQNILQALRPSPKEGGGLAYTGFFKQDN